MKLKTRVGLSYFMSAILLLSICSLSACAQLRSSEPAAQNNDATQITPSGQSSSTPDDADSAREPVGVKKGPILLAYPRGENRNKIDAPATFLIGSVGPGHKLALNGQPVQTNAKGYFAQVVKLAYGKNEFNLYIEGQEADGLKVTVERPAPPAMTPASSFNLVEDSLSPKEEMGATAGDIIQFAARATPGASVTAKIGNRTIALSPALRPNKNGKTTVNLGLATTFGVSFQRAPSALKDLYLGFYKVTPDDVFDKAPIVFTLQKGAQKMQMNAKGSLTIVRQPILLTTAHSDTIVRLGPGAARITPLPEGVRLMADGFIGNSWRLALAPTKHVWIEKVDMVADEDSNTPPLSKVSTVNLESDDYGARIVVPLNQRLPFQVEQDLAGGKLTLHLFGITSDTDFVTSDVRPQDSASAKLLDFVQWKQKSDEHYELIAQLKSKDQWGFYADYEENKLVLHIKSAPMVDTANGTLKGLRICVDPGHGGKEAGSIGCSGVKEATINMALGDQFRRALEALGATVIMTRTSDHFVSLQDRVQTAISSNADLLISVHNNALPDGRDPYKEHGTSSYWYHTQSLQLARQGRERLVQELGLKDYGTRYQNLALCRPSKMLACLMEIGFMINPEELSKLEDPTFQESTGKALANGVRAYIYQKLSGPEDALKSKSQTTNN